MTQATLLVPAWLLLGALAPAVCAQAPRRSVVLVDEEGTSWAARCDGVELIHLAGKFEGTLESFGALSTRGIAANLRCFAPDAERHAELAASARERMSPQQRSRIAAFAAGADVPELWIEVLAALELPPPTWRSDDPSTPWDQLPEGAEPRLVRDADGSLRACWAGCLDGVELPSSGSVGSAFAALLDPTKPSAFEVDNGWDWTLADPLARETGQCVDRPRRRKAARSPEEAHALERFPVEQASFPWRLSWRQRASLWSIADLEFPSGLPSGMAVNDLVRARYFRGERASDEPRPAFILLHHLQENFALEEAVSRSIAARGIDVVLMILPYYGPRHPPRRNLASLVFGSGEEGLSRVAAQAAADVARVRDWLDARSDISTIALGGISLGGIFSALIGSVDGDWPRLAPLLAGGDLAQILRQDSREARGIRRELSKVGLELDQVLGAWAALDPLSFAARVDPATVLMVNAEEDDVIPRASTLALSQAFGGAEIAWFGGGHVSVARNLPAILERLARFLR